MSTPRPPHIAHWFLRCFCRPELLEAVEGDLHELFEERLTTLGTRRARWYYVRDALVLFRPSLIRHVSLSFFLVPMLQNYFKVGLRQLLRHKFYATVSLLGLAVGMAACLLISLYVADELSYDRYHAHGDRLYRVAGNYRHGGDEPQRLALTNFQLAPLLENDFPEIEQWVRLDFMSKVVANGAQKHQETNVLVADSSFFELFSFRLVQGSPATALSGPQQVVLTEVTAQKYFGTQDPMGQTLEIDDQPVLVTGVMEAIPTNTHFHADLVLSMATQVPLYPDYVVRYRTGALTQYTYVLLEEGTDPQQLEAQLENFVATHDGPEAVDETQYFLQPLADIHLRSDLGQEIEPNGSITYVYMFMAVALIILLLACVNYVNLATARATERAKEVGLRKVVGAHRSQLIGQFLGESLLIVLLASVLTAVLVWAAMPLFNQLADKQLAFRPFSNFPLLGGLLLCAVSIGVLAGSYPALVLSAFRSVQVLKGGSVSPGRRSLGTRKILVLGQFVLSIALVIATLVIGQQLHFLHHKRLGFNTHQVVTMPLSPEGFQRFGALKEALQRDPRVTSVTASNSPLTERVGGWRQYRMAGRTPESGLNIPTIDVDFDFFQTIEAEMVAGRSFSSDRPADTLNAYILNETAARFLELDDPVGASLQGTLFNGAQWSGKDGIVIGVVKDFHFASLHNKIEPVVFSLYTTQTFPLRWVSVRLRNEDVSEALGFLETTWQQFDPELLWHYSFVDQELAEKYRAEARFLQVFSLFSGLAILIACLGLLGLTAFAVRQRTKEIGIRKVLGASLADLVLLLTREFLWLVLLAFLIAVPLAWYFMRQWLDDFAYRINLTAWPFVLAGASALLLVWLTCSSQSLRAALANPVRSLRNE
ncbi:putative ABC transport system permease protein [Catalinimonas alkaloidigena]|uniref:Putative ABC transport system permease protein n=1 Tax=Catalinimonas alkaloidigena TaxID=1075417 RepID=A0A1G9GA85_9BACT|nr:ABC transporter permease [Catalinimonas alkaloidigena]SDK97634.1 putative ABC transport system permease protein [Catalinimonas alkaloidigena]